MTERAESICICRPPIGYIVEGDDEYNCYPSLVCRIINVKRLHVPVVNAGGYGNIVRRLAEQLDSLVLSYHPYNVIVTLDLKDVINKHLYSHCRQLILGLSQQAKDWLEKSESNPRLAPLPAHIIMVVQIQTFETWLISDLSNLRRSGCVNVSDNQLPNVDNQILNPTTWLRQRLRPRITLKNPKQAKRMIGKLNPKVMRKNSRSFNKFFKETSMCYARWCTESGIANQ